MRWFKKTDCWLQLALIAAGIIYCLFNPDMFFLPYLAVGAWQLFSTVIHLVFSNNFISHKWRQKYYLSLVIILIITCIFYLLQLLLLPLLALLFISPGLAVWYIIICRDENDMLARKELIHLK